MIQSAAFATSLLTLIFAISLVPASSILRSRRVFLLRCALLGLGAALTSPLLTTNDATAIAAILLQFGYFALAAVILSTSSRPPTPRASKDRKRIGRHVGQSWSIILSS